MKTLLTCLLAVLPTSLFLNAAPADSDPFAQPDPFVRAAAAFARGDLSVAETLLTPLAEGAAPRADACTLLGEIRLGQNRTREAVESFEKASRLNPKSPICHSRLGMVLLQYLGEADAAQRSALAGRAVAALQRSVELDPDHYDGNVGLVHFYSETPAALGGDFDKAMLFAERVRKANGFEGTILLGSIAERQGRLEIALDRYREAVRMYAGSPELCACEGRVLARLGRVAEARACYERILAEFPQYEPARQALAALPAAPAAK
jgi:Flp pilus assembly protein TadD